MLSVQIASLLDEILRDFIMMVISLGRETKSLNDFRVEQGVEEEFIGSMGLGPVLTAKADKNNMPPLIFYIH